jgi:hypothetical protein
MKGRATARVVRAPLRPGPRLAGRAGDVQGGPSTRADRARFDAIEREAVRLLAA